MGSAVAFTERFFWTMVWIAIVLIVMYALLGLIQNRFGGNILGSAAAWTNQHLQPQG